MKRLILLSAALTLFTGCAVTQLTGGVDKSAVEVSGLDDPLETKVRVSTYNYSTPFLGTVSLNTGNPSFRGYKDKASGRKTYQLYTVLNHTDWAYWDELRFNDQGTLRTLPVQRVASDVKCSSYGCQHYEDAVVILDRSTLDRWANSQEEVVVRFISPRVDSSIDVELRKDEIKAFLEKMDEI